MLAETPRNHPIQVELQAEFDRQKSAGWSGWTMGIAFVQGEVDDFCRITGDANHIHEETYAHPVVPGLLLLSALPRYLEGNLPLAIAGHETVVEAVVPRFVGFVGVGKPVAMRYLALELGTDDHGPKATYVFEIQQIGKASNAVEGTITLRFVQSRLFNVLVRRACRQ